MKQLVGLVALVLVGACGEVKSIESDGGNAGADARVSGADARVSGADASSRDAGGGLELLLRAKPTLPGIPMGTGRLVVLFFQLDDDGPDPQIEKGYDVAFDPTVLDYRIPMNAITRPTDRNLLCPRACNDEATCPCAGQPQVGIAYVLLLTDPNGDGQINIPDEFDYNGGSGPAPATIFGVTKIVIGSATMAYPSAVPYDNLFPNGILDGILPYLAEPPAAGGFDQLKPADPSTVYDLVACDPNGPTTCDSLPFPNLT